MSGADNQVDGLIKLADEKVREEDFLGAIEYYKKYLKKDPNNAIIHNRIGYLYGKIEGCEYFDEQIKYFKKALEINNNYTGAARNLALLYSQTDKIEEANEAFNKLFKLGPVTDDYFAYACFKIKNGDFKEGWKYYEFRFLKGYGREDYIETDKPRWEGEDIRNKTLLVLYEQGFGDSIQFVRYIEKIKPLAKKIIFRVQDSLKSLFVENLKDVEIVGHTFPLENLKFDYHTPLISLVRLTNSTIDNIPLSEGYLKANPEKVAFYKKEYFNNDFIKIGISWSGAPTGNTSRDIPLNFFYPLSEIKGAQLYSLQKGSGAQQLKKSQESTNIIDLGKTFNDFADTAAAMANLDFFITSDNVLINLAGAMGIKTCLLLNKNSEWRWFFDKNTTPWYDSVKIYKKQNENESWNLLIQRVIKEIFK